MKNENSLNISSTTVEKALDVVTESTVQSRTALDRNLSGGINKFFEFLSATPIGISIETYIAEKPYKLAASMDKMKKKYETIPLENRTEPSATVAINVAKEINYYLDEEHIRSMFENILLSDMNLEKKNMVSPSYIELVKQLSKEDALFLKFLKEKCSKENPLFEIIERNKDRTYKLRSKKILCISDCDYLPIEELVLDNLTRMKFIEISPGEYLAYDTRYENVFNLIKPDFKAAEDKTIDMKKEKLIITELGSRFMKICFED